VLLLKLKNIYLKVFRTPCTKNFLTYANFSLILPPIASFPKFNDWEVTKVFSAKQLVLILPTFKSSYCVQSEVSFFIFQIYIVCILDQVFPIHDRVSILGKKDFVKHSL